VATSDIVVQVRKATELPFVMVSGIGPGNWCIRWLSTCPKAKGRFRGFLCSICLNGFIFVVRWQKKNVFDSCVKSLQYFRTDNISTESLVNALVNLPVLCYDIEVGNYEKFAKI